MIHIDKERRSSKFYALRGIVGYVCFTGEACFIEDLLGVYNRTATSVLFLSFLFPGEFLFFRGNGAHMVSLSGALRGCKVFYRTIRFIFLFIDVVESIVLYDLVFVIV